MRTSSPNRAAPPALRRCCAIGVRRQARLRLSPVETCRRTTTRSTSRREQAARRGNPFIDGRDFAVELLFIDQFQNLANARTRCEPQRQEMATEQQRRGRSMLDAERAGPLDEPVHRGAIEVARSPEAVGARE